MKPTPTIKTTTSKETKKRIAILGGLCAYAVLATLFITKNLK